MTRPHRLTERGTRVLDVVEGLLGLASIVVVVWILAAVLAAQFVALLPHLEDAVGIPRHEHPRKEVN